MLLSAFTAFAMTACNNDPDDGKDSAEPEPDIMMKFGTNGHKNGEPQPFVAADPRNPTTLRIDYPMMANKYAPADIGYALETSQQEYIVCEDSKDEYWYYAMALENECDGIVDVIFGKSKDYYYKRGDHAAATGGLLNTKNYVLVKFFDETVNSPAEKITAVAIMEGSKVIASTGGSELKRSPTEGEVNAFNPNRSLDFGEIARLCHAACFSLSRRRRRNRMRTEAGKMPESLTFPIKNGLGESNDRFGFNQFWSVRTERDGKWKEGGGAIINHAIHSAFSTQTLPIRRLNEKTVCHPLAWGE